jgi:hypothetical protein
MRGVKKVASITSLSAMEAENIVHAADFIAARLEDNCAVGV